MPDTPWKMPPLVKIYEALGALADGRVTRLGENSAQVASSDGTKIYQVEIGADGREINANDNASYWQGYLGYPAIALLLARGIYPAPPETLEALKGISWKEINRRFRNDWAKTMNEVENRARERGYDVALIRRHAEAILATLEKLALYRTRRPRPPR